MQILKIYSPKKNEVHPLLGPNSSILSINRSDQTLIQTKSYITLEPVQVKSSSEKNHGK
jgi:hypothetical protein